MPLPEHLVDKPLYRLYGEVAAQMDDIRNRAAKIPDDLLLKTDQPTHTALRRCGINKPAELYTLFNKEKHVTTITKLWSQYANNHKYTAERTLDFCRILQASGIYPNCKYEITNNTLYIRVEKRKVWDEWLASLLKKALPISFNVHIQTNTKWHAFLSGKDDETTPPRKWSELQTWP